MFSGLNLAFFSISKLRLEVEASKGNQKAMKVVALRKDSNFLLTTILWGNVGINVLLTLLSHSVLAGVMAFLFSTVIITFFGEIIPQAYFSRHAIKMASLLSPALRLYQILGLPRSSRHLEKHGVKTMKEVSNGAEKAEELQPGIQGGGRQAHHT
jgi:metal transporter CNNM